MPLVRVHSDPRAREKPCLRCGYSLRRIESTHCPECGLSVWRSLNANDELDWSNPLWLSKLVHACRLLAVTQLVGLAAYAFSNVVYALSILGATTVLAIWKHVVGFLPFITTGYEVGLAMGLILLAAEERRYPDKWKGFKWGCRIVGGLSALLALCTFFAAGTAIVRPRIVFVSTFLHYSLTFAIIAGVLAAFAYLRKLAQRVPNSRVAKFCGWILLGPAISLLKTVPIFAVYIAYDLFGWLFLLLPLIYLPITAGLLLWFAHAFKRAARASQKGWEAETAGVVQETC